MRTLYTGITCPNPEYIHTPLIEIFPASNGAELRTAIDDWYGDCGQDISYLLFTSRYGVRYWSLELGGRQTNHPNPNRKVVSIGATTTRALEEVGFTDIQQVGTDDSYGVLQLFSDKPRGKVIIPRSNLALDIIPSGLREMGFCVKTVTAYENRLPENIKKVDLSNIDTIIFTSPSTINNFLKVYGHLPEGKTLKTRGRITEEHLSRITKSELRITNGHPDEPIRIS